MKERITYTPMAPYHLIELKTVVDVSCNLACQKINIGEEN